MSCAAPVPINPGDILRPQNSDAPNASMTFGPVWLPADLVLRRTPPDDRLAAGLVQRAGAARQRESKVDGRLPRGNAGKHAVPHDVLREVLIETEVNDLPANDLVGSGFADRLAAFERFAGRNLQPCDLRIDGGRGEDGECEGHERRDAT